MREKSNISPVVGITVVCFVVYIIQRVICVYVDVNNMDNIRLWATYVNPWLRIFGECLLGVVIACHIDSLKMTKCSGDGLKKFSVVVALMVMLLRDVTSSSLWSAWIYTVPSILRIISFYKEDGKVARALKVKTIQFLGDISFGLYMTHDFVYEDYRLK